MLWIFDIENNKKVEEHLKRAAETDLVAPVWEMQAYSVKTSGGFLKDRTYTAIELQLRLMRPIWPALVCLALSLVFQVNWLLIGWVLFACTDVLLHSGLLFRLFCRRELKKQGIIIPLKLVSSRKLLEDCVDGSCRKITFSSL